MHGQGSFHSVHGWCYEGGISANRPTEGFLTHADGLRLAVTYAKDCSLIQNAPRSLTSEHVLSKGDREDERLKEEMSAVYNDAGMA